MSEVLVFIICLFIFFISLFTLILSYFLDLIPYPRARQVLPLFCGIIFYILFVIFPLSESTSLSILSLLLILPFFIITPLPLVEKMTGTLYGKGYLVFGAAVTTVYFFVVSRTGTYFLTGKWQFAGPEWAVSSIIISSVVFFGIHLFKKYYPDFTGSERESSCASQESSSSGFDAKKFLIITVWIIVLILPVFSPDLILQPSSCGGFTLYRINEPNPPEGQVIHLTDKDFSAYPGLGSILRHPHVYDANRTLTISGTESRVSDLGSVQIYCSESREKYDSLTNVYSPVKYLEYDGKLYYATRAWIH
jgi:hypothetical protein